MSAKESRIQEVEPDQHRSVLESTKLEGVSDLKSHLSPLNKTWELQHLEFVPHYITLYSILAWKYIVSDTVYSKYLILFLL